MAFYLPSLRAFFTGIFAGRDAKAFRTAEVSTAQRQQALARFQNG